MGWSRVVESAGYAEENSAEMGMGGQIRNPGLLWAIFRMDFSPNSSSASSVLAALGFVWW